MNAAAAAINNAKAPTATEAMFDPVELSCGVDVFEAFEVSEGFEGFTTSGLWVLVTVQLPGLVS